MRTSRVIFFTLISGLTALTPFAQTVPGTINYQGRLTDNGVTPAPINGVVNMAFEIWDVPAGGSAGTDRLWAEPASGSTPVLVTGGIFNVLLGGSAGGSSVPVPASVFTGGTARYLQILVNGEALTPRQTITATGFTNQAQNAALALNATNAGNAAQLGGIAPAGWQRALSAASCPAGQFYSAVAPDGTAGCGSAQSSLTPPVDLSASLAFPAAVLSATNSGGGVALAANSATGPAVAVNSTSSLGITVHAQDITQAGVLGGTGPTVYYFNNSGVNGYSSAGQGTVGFTDSGNGIVGYVIGTGTGRAGYFSIVNPANTSPAVYATTSGSGNAVYGVSATGTAIFGQTTGGTGDAVQGNSAGHNGVSGLSASSGDSGIYGENTGLGRAAFFRTVNASSGADTLATYTTGGGRGGWFVIDNPASTSAAVLGTTNGNNGNASFGVDGEATAATGQVIGVVGRATSTTGIGTAGVAFSATGGTYGAFGRSDSNQGTGVWGIATSTTVAAGGITYGVQGANFATSGTAYGVYGSNSSGSGAGVYGTSSVSVGVMGSASNGVYGTSSTSNGTGTLGVANVGSNAWGVLGSSSSGQAGHFSGNVQVVGTLSKSAGSFKIDHPLDPENKYLYHSFVESPDMKNIYDGMITLDGRGEAVVELPKWFDALNRDFRYQLTAVGAPGPNLFIKSKLADNRFIIAGGAPGMEVSWMITGIRKDPFAEKHRIPVEEDKSAEERGYYLQPEAYDLPEEKGIEWATHPELMKRMKLERAQPATPADAQPRPLPLAAAPAPSTLPAGYRPETSAPAPGPLNLEPRIASH